MACASSASCGPSTRAGFASPPTTTCRRADRARLSAVRCWTACAGDRSPPRRPEPEPPPVEEEPPVEAEAPPEPPPRPRERPRDPRHVRAVPTTADVKVERALDLFNGSHHHRTVAGLSRSLGPPFATAVPDPDAPSTVTVLVAWELSWYRYRVDLGDSAEPVSLQGKGDELGDIDEPLRDWNAELDSEGKLVIGAGSE